MDTAAEIADKMHFLSPSCHNFPLYPCTPYPSRWQPMAEQNIPPLHFEKIHDDD